MPHPVDICNMALFHLGQKKEIQNLDTDNSAEARACRKFYDPARSAVLEDFAWPFASKTTALSLIEEDPNDEWAYSYGLPDDCLVPRRILSGKRVETPEDAVAYKLAYGTSSTELFTDQEDAELEYTVDVEDSLRFSSNFVLAMSYRLAAYIASSITAGDPYKLGDKCMRMYVYEISNAKANARASERNDKTSEAEMIRARE